MSEPSHRNAILEATDPGRQRSRSLACGEWAASTLCGAGERVPADALSTHPPANLTAPYPVVSGFPHGSRGALHAVWRPGLRGRSILRELR